MRRSTQSPRNLTRIGSRVLRGVVRKRFEEKTSEMEERAARGWLTERSSSQRWGKGEKRRQLGGSEV